MPYHPRTRSQTDPVPFKHALPRPVFPPPGLTLHPDDQNSKVLPAIANALLAVNNRAMTIKDLAHAALDNGLVCCGASPLNAACQQITSYIRAHHRRCEHGFTKPLLKSYTLTGTSDDDLLTPALYSRAGGTATRRGGAVDTAFRKGTLVWYLTPDTGAQDPFQQAGINLPGTVKKRRRRMNTGLESTDSEEEKRPKIKLKIKLGSLSTRSIPAAPQLPLSAGSSESAPIVLDSSPSTPSSSCSLSLPPYPIQSNTRYLRDIPNSPFEIPEYASPPPDSEDDHDDFHTSMLVPDIDDSDSELVKDEYYSDLDGSDGRRSRSTSWTTIADPKTPRDIDRPTALKVEGYEETLEASLALRWDSPLTSSDFKVEEGSDLHGTWMTQDDLAELMSPEESLIRSMLPPLAIKAEELDEPVPQNHMGRSRSYSAPASTWQVRTPHLTTCSLEPTPECNIEEDGLEILGPDSVPPEEFDDCFWQYENPEGAEAVVSSRSSQRAASPQPDVTETIFRGTVINGIRLHELDINGHILRRRLDNGTVQLTNLLRLLSNKSPSSDFLRLDGASHIKGGILKGTWVPMTFARSLAKGRSVPPELLKFLEESNEVALKNATSSPRWTSRSLMAETAQPNDLLPAFEPIPKADTNTVGSVDSHNQLEVPIRHLSVSGFDSPVWQRDGFTDWKVNIELDSGLAFPRLPSTLRSLIQPGHTSSLSSDTPLSPQEEEIFHSLVDLGMSKPSERAAEYEESVLEADDEQEECSTQLRRSKRVAARTGTARTKGQLNGRRRSARNTTK